MAIDDLKTQSPLVFELHLPGAEATRQLGVEIARLAYPGILIRLSGDLGMGKTTFAQGFAAGLSIEETVNSPSFVLIREYALDEPNAARFLGEGGEGRPRFLLHADLYRLTDPRLPAPPALFEAQDAGAAVLIEWPERCAEIMREKALDLELSEDRVDGGTVGRKAMLCADTPKTVALLRDFQGLTNLECRPIAAADLVTSSLTVEGS